MKHGFEHCHIRHCRSQSRDWTSCLLLAWCPRKEYSPMVTDFRGDGHRRGVDRTCLLSDIVLPGNRRRVLRSPISDGSSLAAQGRPPPSVLWFLHSVPPPLGLFSLCLSLGESLLLLHVSGSMSLSLRSRAHAHSQGQLAVTCSVLRTTYASPVGMLPRSLSEDLDTRLSLLSSAQHSYSTWHIVGA